MLLEVSPTLVEVLAAPAAGSPTPVGDTSSQNAHKDSHPKEAEPAQHTSQHRLWQQTWQLGA